MLKTIWVNVDAKATRVNIDDKAHLDPCVKSHWVKVVAMLAGSQLMLEILEQHC